MVRKVPKFKKGDILEVTWYINALSTDVREFGMIKVIDYDDSTYTFIHLDNDRLDRRNISVVEDTLEAKYATQAARLLYGK